MMQIRYLSDIHLELLNSKTISKYIGKITPNLKQVCVLAGDIGNPYSSSYGIFMDFINESFKKTFIIAGNHEYYNNDKTIEDTNEYMATFFKQYPNISFLNNSYECYDGYCFIGTTLWSKISNPQYKINDVTAIKNLDYIKYNYLNHKAILFLEEVIKNQTNVIIITHHMPSSSLIDAKFKSADMKPYNQWFYCDMNTFITVNKDRIKCWIYGHTHLPSHHIIDGCPIICNPLGYAGENAHLDFNKMIDL
jgi:predicted phosphodiesterase